MSTSIGHKKFKNCLVDLTLIHAFVMVSSSCKNFKGLNKTLGFAVDLRMVRSSVYVLNSTICHKLFKLFGRKLGLVVRN